MKHSYIQELMQAIGTYGLDREDDVAQILLMAEQGMLDEDMAKSYLYLLQDRIDEQIDHPNLLHRLPDEDQLYAQGKPDIVIGQAAENENLKIGLKLLDRPRHVLIAGSTGSGKTTTIRSIIHAIEKLNHG